jgi:cardiolipin synthase
MPIVAFSRSLLTGMTALGPVLISLVHVALALGVSVHVLLHKRDVNSAAGWIGLSWLAPILGSILYLLLGINRVRRRALSLRGTRPEGHAARLEAAPARDHELASLERAGRRLTRRPTETGNAISILRNGDEGYPAMLAAIDAAHASVALASYIFRDDAAGRPFIEALQRARRRGAEVRVLIDGVGGGYFHSGAHRELARAGVRAARFMHSPLPWRMPFLNLRCHKKILVLDGRLAFTGGLNIGAENLLRAAPRHPVSDTHFRIEGPVVGQILEVFAEDWFYTTGELLQGEPWAPDLTPAGASTARIVTSGPDQDLEKIEFLILEAIGCARRAVRIMTPYFLPDERLITALALAALRGVEVDLLIPLHSNHPAVDWASRAALGPLLDAGCRVFLHPPPFNHSKLMTVDGAWALVGSANWDMRSFRLNFEIDVEIYDATVVAAVDALIDHRHATPLTAALLRHRSLPGVLRDSAARLMLPYL